MRIHLAAMVTSLASAAAPAQDGITVDAFTRVVLGEQDRISANLFGITAFEGFPTVIADRDCRARVAALRPPGSSCASAYSARPGTRVLLLG